MLPCLEIPIPRAIQVIMGKRKTVAKAAYRPSIPLQNVFSCPFCNMESSCDVKLDKTRNTGRITCRVCMECFQTRIHALSDPIDVYNDWIDECEKCN
ncbi:unnamed protein product [Allacma fusca]|uniref:Transcription elongation factor 1 homolog n=1 Tax=Allacma fusca TaxID=39272 RepID=A0A8J2J8V5_9HEXA|nr:unnamed protein product [Allacma fusca]